MRDLYRKEICFISYGSCSDVNTGLYPKTIVWSTTKIFSLSNQFRKILLIRSLLQQSRSLGSVCIVFVSLIKIPVRKNITNSKDP